MYKTLIRPLFFLFDAEKIHHFVFSILKIAFAIPGVKRLFSMFYQTQYPQLNQTIMGLHFKNPLGLAAGFDKNALLFDELSTFGFGFIEIGTVTPKPQVGNDKPRMFRLTKDKALINRMGFNNDGVQAAAVRLKNRNPHLIIGGNIGKNKSTANENAIEDYSYCFNVLYDVVDYFVVNVSSPNTPGLRALQEKEPLTALLNQLQTLNNQKIKPKPILLKIAPDLSPEQLDEIVDIIKLTKLTGIIATNTTLSREGLTAEKNLQSEAGGLSGKPLKKRSTEVIRYLRKRLGKEIIIIGSGGIFSAEDAEEKLNAGANLVQVYTGFIYEGPAIIKKITKHLVAKNRAGF